MREILAVFLLLGSISANADHTVSAQQISTTHVNTTTGFYFKTVGPVENPEGCLSSGWYHIKADGLYSKEAFSVVLAAHVSGKNVQFSIKGCDNNYPAVVWVNTYGG